MLCVWVMVVEPITGALFCQALILSITVLGPYCVVSSEFLVKYFEREFRSLIMDWSIEGMSNSDWLMLKSAYLELKAGLYLCRCIDLFPREPVGKNQIFCSKYFKVDMN